MVFILRQIQEKCREQNKALYVTFMDLTKAFDTVSGQGLWKNSGKARLPTKVPHHDHPAPWRPAHSPSLLQMVWNRAVFLPPHCSLFSMMLQQTTEDLDKSDGIYIRFRLDGSVFNLRPTQRPWSYWSGSCCLLTMPPSLLTQRQLCS